MSARFSKTRLRLLGSGSVLPGPAVSNDELLAALNTLCGYRAAARAAKYVRRLGIRSRHLSRDLAKPLSGTIAGRDAPELCRLALQQATGQQEMSYLIGHTATPHTLLPPNIAWVAQGMRYDGPYLELRQACTGFANALAIAAAMVAEDPAAKIGMVGSETGSPFFDISEEFADKEQLINYVQMGDGAGAAFVAAADGNRQIISDIFNGQIGIDREPGISLESGGSMSPSSDRSLPWFRHNAREVRKHGEQLLLKGIEAVESRGYKLDDFDWLLPHQANGHIAAMVSARFPSMDGKVFVTADKLGNLGSAAIWVGLDLLIRSKKLQRGQRVLVLGAEASKYLYGGFVFNY